MNKDQKSSKYRPGQFCWNELMTTNEAAAKKFYTRLLGWKTKPFGNGMDYTLFMKGKDNVGGMMKAPKPGPSPQWFSYVLVDDVDATVKKAAKLGGKVMKPAFDVPKVGRLAFLRDPQGAAFAILKPE